MVCGAIRSCVVIALKSKADSTSTSATCTSAAWEEHVRRAGAVLFERLRAEATRAAVDEDEAMDLVEDAKRRVYKYYIPVYEEVVSRLRTHRATRGTTPGGRTPKPMVVGVSAPQGCGKTTLTRTIVDLIRETPKKFLDESAANEMGNVTAMTLSVDDFYLTYDEQTALGDAHADNDMLRYRGNAGTHELELGTKTIEALGRINDVDGERDRRRAAARMRHGRDPDPRDRSDDVRRRLATRARRRRREQRAGRTLGMSFFRFARSLARTPCFLCLRRRRETDERRRDGERTTETFKTDLLGWTRRERVASLERC